MCDFLSDFFLFVVVVIDGRVVLWVSVGILLVESCGVVSVVEEFEEVEVGDFFGVVDDLGSFSVCYNVLVCV